MRITLLITALTFGALLGSSSIGAAAEEGWTVMADMPTAKFGMSVVELDGKLFAIGGSQANAISATVEEYDPASDSWKSVADMPTARKDTAAAVVDGKIYVFGGAQAQTHGSIRTTESYDPATDTWTTKKDMPTARAGLTAVPVDGKIYVIGGWGVSAMESAVEVYDPATDTWEEKARLPIAYGNFGFARFNGKIYLFGGNTTEGPRMDTREYDPVTDSWTSKAAMPIARNYPSASVLNGRIYVLGGNRLIEGVRSVTSRVDVYDPVADTWEQGVSMPTARGNLSAVTLNGQIHAIGGQTGISWGDPGTVYATVEVYSPASEPPAEEGWTVMADMPTAKFGMSVVELDGKLFAIGGSQANARCATVEEYDPASDSWKSLADMPTARKQTAAAVVDGKIYVFGGSQVQTSSSIRTTESYDPATDTWTTKKDMPTARLGLTAVPVDGKIYVIGGWGASSFESVVEVYDPATDTWEAKTNTPAADGNFGFAGVNGKVYLFGGTRNRTITREYDPVTDTWTTKAAIPNGRHVSSATVLDGKVYVLGGSLSPATSGTDLSPTDRMDIYDPVADTWTEGLKMPTARGNLSAVTLNGRIHAIGGHTGVSWGNPGTVYATVEVYSPASDIDSDGDGMADRWEIFYFGDLSHDGTEDTDGDGLNDLGEYENRANPTVLDTDGDGLSDGDEVHVYGTDPTNPDTDGDGLSDGDEVNVYGTDPLKRDTDGDNFDDNVELALGTDPNDPDDFPAQIIAVRSGPWDSAATWSNNQAPTAGNDYLLVGSVAAQLQTTAITFPGDSLTIAGPGATLFSSHSGDASVADLIVENGAIEAGRNGNLGGRITMSGDNVINPRTATFTINAAISGDGTLAIQSGDPGDHPVGTVILLGAGGAYAGSTTVTGTTLTLGAPSVFAGDITLEGANLIINAGQLIPQATLFIRGDGFTITLNSNLQVGDVIGLDANGAQGFSLRDLLELEPNERAELTAAALGEVFGNADLAKGDGLLIVFDDSVPPDPFEIRDVRRMQVDESEVLEITFSLTPGVGFAVETTTNLQDWSEVANGLATADADATTYRLQLTAPVAKALYIRVKQE